MPHIAVAIADVGFARSDRNAAICGIASRADHTEHDRKLIARVVEAARQTFGDAKPALDLGQQQHAGLGGQAARIEGHSHRLAANRWQTAETPLPSSMAGAHSVAAW
jgi:hypothetical protein